ncbi:hypothetical protein Tco_0647944 [Tanacetum coccineum]
MVAASKVPMLKPSKYEIWRMRIEQYIQMIEYALWEVIENGATLPKTTTVEGVVIEMPITTEELFTHKEEMDLETAQITTTAKLPTLKQGEYDMWRLWIEQYFQVQDYALWVILENRNSFKPVAKTTTNADGISTTLIPGPVTIEEKVQKKNDMKAKSMLLMALPNEHLVTFNRLQKIISQLAILGENISQEDLNLKFLRSLPSEWNTHVVVWRNKPDLDIMSFENLYNNFKIVEQEVKGTASSSSSSNSQNVAFVSSSSSTNKVNTAYGVSNTNTQVNHTSTQVSTASTQLSTAA